MQRRNCVNHYTCKGIEITQVRDPFFAIEHELAFMPVCGTCFDEYMSLDPEMGYYEIPMVDTQIKTDDITLRFSHAAATIHQPIKRDSLALYRCRNPFYGVRQILFGIKLIGLV